MFGLVFCFFAAAGLQAAAANTVMVYTKTVEGQGEIKETRGTLEDGIMAVFFDAGHIVFNGFPPDAEEDEEPPDLPEDISFRIAKSGGASLLLEVDMCFGDDEEEKLLQSVRYRYFDLFSGELLDEGSLLLSDIDKPEEPDGKTRLRLLGEKLALRVLR